MIRVLHVTESLAAGGIETTFLNVLRAWRDAPPWAAHHVLAPAGGTLAAEYAQAADVVTVAATTAALERAVLGPFDVVHFIFERCAYRLLPVVVARSRAAVVYGKGYDMGGMFRTGDGLIWQPDESLMWGSDQVTFTTDRLASGFSVPGPHPLVLGKAAAVRRFAALRPPDASTPQRIVAVANLHARKRLGDLVTAVARLRREFDGLTVRLVGADNGSEGARLQTLAAHLGIGDACEIVGRRDDVAGDLADSRIFALPSGCEGVPTAMLEAMAAARPVVVTDVGHVASALTDGVEGYIVAAGDVDHLTARLRALLTDPAGARAMGLAGRRRAMGHDVVVVAARLRGVLERAGERRAA